MHALLLSQRVTYFMIDEAEAELTAHGIPFNRPMWERVVKEHDGKLPVRIRAIPEGVVVPQGTVLVTSNRPIRNAPASPLTSRRCCSARVVSRRRSPPARCAGTG
jgi:hypothetical protein